jgi:hypothetical protein
VVLITGAQKQFTVKRIFPLMPSSRLSQHSVLTWKYAYAQFYKKTHTDNTARYVYQTISDIHTLLAL